eukprot:CAMPEP_0181431358 /NCGR_PEP_ID=MMETSP1110-20121109/18205_1 /TAXON_ID=174948 /ORGANISM="Symbiodinium sp., Strain CCMP421" /LENGTH=555 /DNA_ID=CAMNT_0023554717 /DNA_START=40 /DNA_END=1704 /DNA_ORIENTATION=+
MQPSRSSRAGRRRHATWSQSSASPLLDAGDGGSSSSNGSSEEESEDDGLAIQKVSSLPVPARPRKDTDELSEGSDFMSDMNVSKVQSLFLDRRDRAKGRGYLNNVDKVERRRSRTFKSITVPEEVLEAVGGPLDPLEEEEYGPLEDDEYEDEYGDSERPTGPVRRRVGTLSSGLKVDIHTDTVRSNKEAKEETMRFFEPGLGAPAPRHPEESGDRTPEMERQRAAAIEKLASAAKKLNQKLQRQQEANLRRRSKRHLTEPSPTSLGQEAREAIKEAEAEVEAESFESVPIAGGVPAVLIFDWDDTLFPTRHVTETVKLRHPKDEPLPPESPYYMELQAHAKVVESILVSAREVGRVSIVTLARRPWVENSAAWYLPGINIEKLFQDLEIEIFYAREHITRPHIYNAQLEEGVDMFVIAKRNAMLKCLRKIYGASTRTMHVISVGDSTVEHLAAKEVLWCCPQEAGSFCKTIKLMSDPSVQNLTEELQVLTSWLQQIVACEKDFDISFESEDFNDNITVTLDKKVPAADKQPFLGLKSMFHCDGWAKGMSARAKGG